MRFFLLVLLVPSLPVAPAAAAIGDWGQGQQAEVRLLAAGIGADGKLNAAIEIVLPQGWHTYWRSPGDAGVVPIVDFSASKNLGPADISFPVPTRLDDGFAVTNVYDDRVVLPVSAVVLDKAAPVELSLKLTIGVCDEICVPDEIIASLTVSPAESDATAAAEITEARALIPGAAEFGTFALDAVVRDGGGDNHPVFRFTGTVPDPAHAAVFVEGPADWAPYTPDYVAGERGKSAWSVKFSRTGSKIPIAGASFRVTIRSGGRAIDQTLGLD